MDAIREWLTIERMMTGDFNPNHDPDTGQFSSGTGIQAPELGEYQYHATRGEYVWSIYEQGLKPNRGIYGRGVYFAPSEQGAKDWTDSTTGGKTVLRVKTKALKDKYGWEDMDDTQSMAAKKISPKDIEIRVTGTNEWLPLQEYRDRKWRSYQMWKQNR